MNQPTTGNAQIDLADLMNAQSNTPTAAATAITLGTATVTPSGEPLLDADAVNGAQNAPMPRS